MATEEKKVPRGFGSTESKKKRGDAMSMVKDRYPAMTVAQVGEYLAEVGAGRILALYNFDSKSEAPAPAKKAKASAKKAKK
jgi:hypothetical protein